MIDFGGIGGAGSAPLFSINLGVPDFEQFIRVVSLSGRNLIVVNYNSIPINQRVFSVIVFVDPEEGELENLEETGGFFVVKGDSGIKNEVKASGQKSITPQTTVFKSLGAPVTQGKEASFSSCPTQKNTQEPHKDLVSTVKKMKQLSSLSEAFQDLSQKRPDLSPQLDLIRNCLEKKQEVPGENLTPFEKLPPKDVKTNLSEMGSKELDLLAKALLKDHPVLACRIMKEVFKGSSEEELKEFVESLREEHPPLAVEAAKFMKGELKNPILKELIECFISKSPESALAAAKSLKGEESSKSLEKLALFFKESNLPVALEAAKAVLGGNSSKILFSLVVQFAKNHPGLALEAAKEIRGKDRLEWLVLLVKQLHKQHPKLALKIAHLVLELAKAVQNPQVRGQLLAFIAPPLEVKNIGIAANPFAQGFTFRSSNTTVTASKSKEKPKKKEKEEEESQGMSLFTFYVNSSFEIDFIQKIQKSLLLEGIRVKIKDVKDYEKLIEELKEEKMGSVFFQRKRFLKLPFVSLVDLYIEPFGLYSEKVRSIQEFKNGSRVAIPKEPFDRNRALVFLEKLGLKECLCEEVALEDISKALEEFEAVIMPSLEAWRFGFLSRALAIEDKTSPYVHSLAVRLEEIEEEEFILLKKCLTSKEMRLYMTSEYQGVVVPAF